MERTIYSVVSGTVIKLEKVDDPAFAGKLLGDGIAVRPKKEKQTIVAPCDGKVTTINPSNHAVALLMDDQYEILIHIGVDTVLLKGEGFKSFVKAGDNVKKGQKMVEVDFNLIVDKVPSTDVITVLVNLGDNELVKTTKQQVNSGDAVLAIAAKNSGYKIPEQDVSEKVISPLITVLNEVGIHARPASILSQMANKFKSTVTIKKGDKTANAKSMIGVMGLGIKYKEEIQIIAEGEDALQAVENVVKAVNDGLGEEIKPVSGVVKPPQVQQTTAAPQKPVLLDFSKEVSLKGVVGSPGLVIGKSFVFSENEYDDIKENSSDKEFEHNSFKAAIKKANDRIKSAIVEAEDKKQTAKVEIFKAHLNILDDESVLDDVVNIINKGKTAAFAWRKAIANCIQVLMDTGNKLLKERAADYKDVERRVLRILLQLPEEIGVKLPPNSIVVAKDLVPSDISHFGDNLAGVVLAEGSSTSHVSLIIRNMGIPALIAVGEGVLHIAPNVDIVLDTTHKEIIVNPGHERLNEIKEFQKKLSSDKEKNVSNAHLPAVTKDGVRIIVAGNISNSEQAGKVASLGADGIGLFRTEFLFISSQSAPSEELQKKLYQDVIDSIKGDVTLRTLDVGGDKPLPYIEGIGNEQNPILGIRGVRNYSKNRDIFVDQVRAILQMKPLKNVHIMIPMISDIYEIEWVKEVIAEECKKLNITEKVSLGTMVEVPSAAIIAEQLAEHVDFFSIGTNDLTQYTLAMDRGNPNLTARLIDLHPAVLKLIKMTVDGGNKHNIKTAVCGAMASDIKSIPILVGLGVSELSTSMLSIPDVKALIRDLSYSKCKEVAEKALTLGSAEEVIELVEKEFKI